MAGEIQGVPWLTVTALLLPRAALSSALTMPCIDSCAAGEWIDTREGGRAGPVLGYAAAAADASRHGEITVGIEDQAAIVYCAGADVRPGGVSAVKLEGFGP